MANKKNAVKKKEVLRQCVGCGEKKSKNELIRVIRTPEGEICIDETGKKNGRGVYICNSADCLNMAIKKKSLTRSLKCEIKDEVYDSLREKFK
ncbi:MAG: YlxR family protein [Lachnospiraceae bacterium]|nr:YlxR family protein [Lachnospiraceae bacterium]